MAKAYGGKRKMEWLEVFAGEKAFNEFKEWLPDDTVDAVRDFRVAIKGPLTTPVGGGIRSLNVTLRQILDLYVCVRPVRYFTGVLPRQRVLETHGRYYLWREYRRRVHQGLSGRSGTPGCEEADRLFESRDDERRVETDPRRIQEWESSRSLHLEQSDWCGERYSTRWNMEGLA